MSKIRKSANGKDCQVRLPGVCTFDPATTIWSHYRGEAGGKGGAIKSDDICGAYACTACDAVYDGQRPRPAGMTKEEVDLDWLVGHIRSIRILAREGLI
ncbi:nuclease domain-containing protein [Cupriavidus respiraculi]|uniref:Nuclease YbcO n=1 Tax=Cupriavidus respiraculi TaxID=195930 RepID=A0ABM8WY21_9BURK|nr:nuclease domain-containing protein [Cupriavidus respiraculi]CAG9172435.1 Putative nuclease YbcO [Cupriavidus respiraculi]